MKTTEIDGLTTTDISALLGYDPTTVLRWIKSGKLKATRGQKRIYYISWSDLIDFIRRFDKPILDFPDILYDHVPLWYKKHPRKPPNWHKWWNKEEKCFLVQNYHVLGPKRIAQILGRNPRAIVVYMSKLRKEVKSLDAARTYISRRRRAA